MEKILLIYAPEKGSTERAAKKIAEVLGKENVTLQIAGATIVDDIKNSKYCIFGSSTIGRDTWETKHPEMGWDSLIHQLDDIDFTGKTTALFGLGNQIFYPDNFVDTMGIMGKKLLKKGAKVVGQWSTEGYEFNASEAEIARGKFIGLALDEDNTSEMTDDRISRWCEEIKKEFGI